MRREKSTLRRRRSNARSRQRASTTREDEKRRTITEEKLRCEFENVSNSAPKRANHERQSHAKPRSVESRKISNAQRAELERRHRTSSCRFARRALHEHVVASIVSSPVAVRGNSQRNAPQSMPVPDFVVLILWIVALPLVGLRLLLLRIPIIRDLILALYRPSLTVRRRDFVALRKRSD